MKFCFFGGFCAALLFAAPLRAQTFNYSVQQDAVVWQELQTQTLCNTVNTTWQPAYTLAIGFPFTYLGQAFDSVRIETNGYLTFGGDNHYCFIAFANFSDQLDSNGLHSVLSYERSGSGNNQVLKIQYKNVSRSYMQDSLSYQLWLHTDGRVELLAGPHAIAQDSLFAVHVGLVNRMMDTSNRGLLLSGTFAQANAVPVNEQTAELPYLNLIPISGRRFTFVPANN